MRLSNHIGIKRDKKVRVYTSCVQLVEINKTDD
jgi:hypothetical protein